MTPSHTIRLHAAWKRMVPGHQALPTENVTVSLPDESLVECQAACTIYRRSFNRPTGISPRTVVLLASDLLPLARSVRLNGHPLVSDCDAIEITPLLLAHNELVVVLQRDEYLAASQASATLQIIEPA